MLFLPLLAFFFVVAFLGAWVASRWLIILICERVLIFLRLGFERAIKRIDRIVVSVALDSGTHIRGCMHVEVDGTASYLPKLHKYDGHA